jgi:8-oxo-dGTP pyrophosphatase MutT (NUDIX family)
VTDAELADPPELPVRFAGRVLVFDPDGRVLLFKYEDPPPNGSHWNTPGGGLEPGEDYHSGAQRELIEETGWRDVPVAPEVVHRRTIIMEHGGDIVRQVEEFFTARVSIARRSLGEVGLMHVSDGINGSRWWSAAELEATDEKIWPDGLAGLVSKLQ